MTGSFNPRMLTLARESRGMAQGEVATLLGVSKTLLSRIEHDDYAPTPAMVAAVAKITGYPTAFFYQHGEPVSGHLLYRKRAVVAPRILNMINANINIMRLQLNIITSGLKIKTPSLPAFAVTEAMHPALAATKLRKLWKLTDDAPIPDLCALLEMHGIIILPMKFGTARVDSRIFFTDKGIPVICYNNTLKGDRQRFTLAFELAHLVMHTNTTLTAEQDINHEANLFAAALLMPEKGVLHELNTGIDLPKLAALKREWKVSMIALLYRADDLGLISANQKRYLTDQFNKMGIRRNEPPELDIAAETPRLLQQYIEQYRNKMNIQNKQLAERLCMYTKELHERYQL